MFNKKMLKIFDESSSVKSLAVMPLKHKLVILKILYPALTCSHRSALLGGPPMTQNVTKFPQGRRHLIKGRR